MFSAKTFSFLKSLKRNNRREWFQARKSTYESDIVKPAGILVEALNERSLFRRLELHANPKKPLFRIHRDVRFSHDKSPYKTHNGLLLSRSGARDDQGVFYVHLEPANCFAAVGIWHPEPSLMVKMRTWVAQNPDKALGLVKKLRSKKLVFDSDESLKRIPRGFEDVEGAEIISLLKQRNWIVSRNYSETEMTSKSLPQKLEKFLQDSRPLLEICWDLVDEWRRAGLDPNFLKT